MREGSFFQLYELHNKLGQGQFSQVRAAVHVSGEQRAVKVQQVHVLSKLRTQTEVWHEVSGHPNVVALFEAFETQGPSTYYSVMEICKSSILEWFESSPDNFMSPDNFKNVLPRLFHFLQQTLLGLAHMHSKRIVHRSVKPSNIMLGGADGRTAKLSDFGLARHLPRSGLLHEVVGSVPYMAPEMLGRAGYGETVDLWSLGVAAYLMLFGAFPYAPEKNSGVSMKTLIRQGMPSPTYQRSAPSGRLPDRTATVFVKDLLERCPLKRKSVPEILHGLLSIQPSPCSTHSPPAGPRSGTLPEQLVRRQQLVEETLPSVELCCEVSTFEDFQSTVFI